MTIEQYLNEVGFAEDHADYLVMCRKAHWHWTQAEQLLANQLEEALKEGVIAATPAFVKEPA